MKHVKEYKVVRKSLNTNSFGLHRLVVVAKDGDAYQTHASMYNAKEEGEMMKQIIETNDERVVISEYFEGCEMTTKLPRPDKETLNEIFK